MTRWIAAFGCALTLVLAVPVGNEARADGYERAPVARAYTRKRCIAPTTRWMRLWRTSETTWICAASEKCCYDRLLRKGTCLAASARCF